MGDIDLDYRYARPSAVAVGADGVDLQLSTWGGSTPDGAVTHPHFFEGYLSHAEVMATALLVVARVARTRFWMPPGMVAARVATADPVVTSNGDRLRFESFSACGGVYARLDVLPEALDGPARTGTTNVDFNPAMRAALARIGGADPMHLSVGQDVTLATFEGTVTERKVPLPSRWVRGFAEVHLICAAMEPLLELGPVPARSFLRGLPTVSSTGGAPLFAAATARGARLTGRAVVGSVPLAGPQRLKIVEPVLRFASGVRGYGARSGGRSGAGPALGSGAWEVDLPDARLVVVLSPDLGRGFSGEGGVLWDLADGRSEQDADLVGALLAFEPRIDVEALARDTGLTPDRVGTALSRLGAAGRVGYDGHERAFFHRELPYDAAVLEGLHPRLGDARALVTGGGVRPDPVDPTVTYVRDGSGTGEHVVRRVDGDLRCSCPWYGRHQDTRGPCRHALAVGLSRHGNPQRAVLPADAGADR